MPSGTGTNIFQKKHPERFFDVGIAEGHAVTFAGGLATQGIRPVVAIYSTFLQRAYDNIIHDIAVQQLPVIVLHGPRGTGGRGRPDPHGPVRHRLHAGGAGHDGDRAEGRRRADRPAAHRAGAHRRPVLHPLSARQGARRAATRGRDRRRCRTGRWEQLRPGRRRRDPRGGHHGAARACRRPSCSRPTGSTAAVVNCRFLKPLDYRDAGVAGAALPDPGDGRGGHHRERLRRLPRRDAADHPPRGARRRARRSRPAHRAGAAGRAARARSGSPPPASRARITALQHEESLEAR